ncbi:MAG TPA: hypothetical protein VGH73_00320 [Thermoanaerobaculia bacterium]
MTPDGNEPFRLLEAADPGPGRPGRGYRVEIPAGSPLFAGHFPGHPILPGVAQLAMVERALGAPLAAVRSLRLRRPVAPGDALDFLLTPSEDDWTRFEIRRHQEMVSGGAVASGQGEIGGREEGSAPAAGVVDLPVLLPHAPPARFIASVLAVSAEGIVCAAAVPAAHPLAEKGRLPACLGIEAAAQAAAVLEALARREGEAPGPRIGYLVGVREARFAVPSLPAGRPFRVTARRQGSAPPLAVYEIAAGEPGAEWLTGTISTFLPGSGETTRGE